MDNSDPKVEELLAGFLEKLMAGENADEVRDKLIADHPDLQPELERRLRFATTVFKLTSPGSQEQTKSLSEPVAKATSRFAPEERVQKLSCPHCGTRLNVVDANIHEVTCGNCGSLVTIGGTDSATQPIRQTPTSIGRFRVLSFLGSGGFGTAYLAHDPTLGRNVALKVPRAGQFATRNERERFIREARSAANLHHDNIVQVYEINADGDYPYIVSEYIDGMTLAERITGLPIAHEEVARLMILVAEAVHYAHQCGIIHRDLKPSNIFLNSSQKPYVADFGLARNLATEHTMTMEGEILGTPAFMSPEQANGLISQISARSDVYSLGVILYRLLCGENPFRASGRMLMHQVVHDDPIAPRRISDRIPVDLETITLKAMQKNAEERYASAKELAEDLRRWMNDQAILARPESNLSKVRRWCRNNRKVAGLLTAIAGLLIVVSILSGVWALREKWLGSRAQTLKQLAENKAVESQRRLADADTQNGLRQMERGVYAQALLWFAKALNDSVDDTTINRIRCAMLWNQHPRLTLTKATGSPVRKLKFSPKGDFLVTGTMDGDLIRISANRYDETPLVLPHSSALIDVKIAADQERMLVLPKESKTVLLRQLDTGLKIAELLHDAIIAATDISPDGLLAATVDQTGKIKIWDARSGAFKFEFSYGQERSAKLRFIDGDRLLAYAQSSSEEDMCPLICWKISDQAHQQLFEVQANLIGVQVDEPTRSLLISERDGPVSLYDLDSGKAREAKLANSSTVQANYVLAKGEALVSVLLDGTLTIWSKAGDRKLSIRHPVGIVDSAVDPSKRFLAIAGTDGLVTVYWLHLLQLASTPMVADQSVSSVAFHPDGRRLAAGGSPGIVRMWDLAGLAPQVPLMQHQGAVRTAKFSPSGDKVISASDDQEARLWNSANGKGLGEPITFSAAVVDVGFDKHGDIAAAASVDGSIKFVQAGSAKPVGQTIDLGSAISRFQFSPSNAAMLIAGCADGTIARIDVPNTQIVYKSTHTKTTITDLQFSPDGSQIVVGSTDTSASLRTPDDGKVLTPPLAHKDSVTRCGFSNDGRIAWTCSTDRALRRWNTTSPFDVKQLDFTSWPTCVAYTAQGNYLTTTYEGEIALWHDDQPLWQTSHRAYRFRHCQCDSQDRLALVCGESAIGSGKEQGSGVVVLLDLATGQPVSPPLQHFANVYRAYFDRSGNRVLTSSQDHSVRIWEIEQDDRPIDQIRNYAAILCGADINDSSQLIPIAPERSEALFVDAFKAAPEKFSCQPDEIDRWNGYVDWVLQRESN